MSGEIVLPTYAVNPELQLLDRRKELVEKLKAGIYVDCNGVTIEYRYITVSDEEGYVEDTISINLPGNNQEIGWVKYVDADNLDSPEIDKCLKASIRDELDNKGVKGVIGFGTGLLYQVLLDKGIDKVPGFVYVGENGSYGIRSINSRLRTRDYFPVNIIIQVCG